MDNKQPQKLGRGMEQIFPNGSQKESNLSPSFILDIWHPDWETTNVCLLSHPVYGTSLRKP